ncbi:beta family protein [Acidovorax sp.]|jgi:hypothetical protein|uniref:beta family protein n=1 Tax=Acidovorax sp. TaxID=1872122 RepID=UPI0027B980CD|nr:beta family protein [Acidovorax sp.]
MFDRKKVIYVPALRMKRGELEGLAWLQPDVADCIAPLLIVPPAKERDCGSQESFFETADGVPDVGAAVAKYWVHRQVFVDVKALFKEKSGQEADGWLPAIFARARSMGVFAIPVATIGTLEKMGVGAFKSTLLADAKLKFGLRIESGDLADPSLDLRIKAVLSSMGLSASACTVFADFSDADLSIPSVVEPIIRGALEQLQTLGHWQLICFLGTHYPEKIPADPGETFTQPRNEWRAWKAAIKFEPSTAEHMIFGDFGADNAKIDFRSGGGAQPIVHCRYTTQESWMIVRGDNEGNWFHRMKAVYGRIVDSGKFSGPEFSEADRLIYDVAQKNAQSVGGPSAWRQVNTTHHITRVVADIATVRSIPISTLPTAPVGAQQELMEGF